MCWRDSLSDDEWWAQYRAEQHIRKAMTPPVPPPDVTVRQPFRAPDRVCGCCNYSMIRQSLLTQFVCTHCGNVEVEDNRSASPPDVTAGLRALIAKWRVESKQFQRNAEHFDGCNGRPLNPKKQRDLRIQAASIAQCINELEAVLQSPADPSAVSAGLRAAAECVVRVYNEEIEYFDSSGADPNTDPKAPRIISLNSADYTKLQNAVDILAAALRPAPPVLSEKEKG